MGFFKSKKGSIISDYFMLRKDVGQIKANNAVDVALYEDHLELSAPMSKQPITLNYSQITDVYYGFEKDIVEKNKSVIGRAVLGGVLFGGVGAVVGAASGSGKKETTVTRFVFVISYTSRDGNQDFLTFEDTRCYKGGKVAKILKEKCNIAESPIVTAI